MLTELHVKNLALIEKADLEFGPGLNVLSGETGAGKSILIDSINVALGAKTGKDIIRSGCDYAYVELLFAIDDDKKLEKIRAMELSVEDDGTLIISRKIMPGRSVARVNDETVTASKLRELTGLLIDMHGQFEHQSLLTASSHLDYIDRMSDSEELLKEIGKLNSEYNELNRMLSQGSDKALREREADILRYEIKEIEEAGLKAGEEEELLTEYRRLKNYSRISSLLSDAARELEDESTSRASKDIAEASSCDEGLNELKTLMNDLEDMLYEARRSLNSYVDGMDFDEESFDKIERRLEVIHHLQGKYGDDIDEILELAEKKKERLTYLDDYDGMRESLLKKKQETEDKLTETCDKLSVMRQSTAALLKVLIKDQLEDLNFLGVDFDIRLERLDTFTAKGNDSAEFMISTNPGNPLKPLKDVASGGELSRIMLAMKTVMADIDDTDTLVFDEIDAGISGITAQAVAEKLSLIGRSHQVLCITHLAQIAAMADSHYLISKSTDGVSTRTDISLLDEEKIIPELARLMSGTTDNESVIAAARELKKLAESKKDR